MFCIFKYSASVSVVGKPFHPDFLQDRNEGCFSLCQKSGLESNGDFWLGLTGVFVTN